MTNDQHPPRKPMGHLDNPKVYDWDQPKKYAWESPREYEKRVDSGTRLEVKSLGFITYMKVMMFFAVLLLLINTVVLLAFVLPDMLIKLVQLMTIFGSYSH